MNNGFIRGIDLQTDWRDVEPVEGKLNWSKLDERIAAAQSSKKWVKLSIFPGFFTPAWALDGVTTESFAMQYGPGRGTVERLPVPWDTVYLSRWFAFVKLVSDRYAKSPALKVVGAGGPTSVSEEMTLPQTPQDLKKWQTLSYTPSKYIAAWQQTFKVYAASFPNQCVSLTVGYGLPINNRAKIDAHEAARTRQKVIDHAIRLLAERFILQNSDLHGGPGEHEATKFVLSYVGSAIRGLEMRCPAERCSAVMGADGNPPLALRRSIEKGMQPNSAGQRVKYLEIYQTDVVADEMQPVLRYGASLFNEK